MLNGTIAHINSILPALNEVKYLYFLSLIKLIFHLSSAIKIRNKARDVGLMSQ